MKNTILFLTLVLLFSCKKEPIGEMAKGGNGQKEKKDVSIEKTKKVKE